MSRRLTKTTFGWITLSLLCLVWIVPLNEVLGADIFLPPDKKERPQAKFPWSPSTRPWAQPRNNQGPTTHIPWKQPNTQPSSQPKPTSINSLFPSPVDFGFRPNLDREKPRPRGPKQPNIFDQWTRGLQQPTPTNQRPRGPKQPTIFDQWPRGPQQPTVNNIPNYQPTVNNVPSYQPTVNNIPRNDTPQQPTSRNVSRNALPRSAAPTQTASSPRNSVPSPMPTPAPQPVAAKNMGPVSTIKMALTADEQRELDNLDDLQRQSLQDMEDSLGTILDNARNLVESNTVDIFLEILENHFRLPEGTASELASAIREGRTDDVQRILDEHNVDVNVILNYSQESIADFLARAEDSRRAIESHRELMDAVNSGASSEEIAAAIDSLMNNSTVRERVEDWKNYPATEERLRPQLDEAIESLLVNAEIRDAILAADTGTGPIGPRDVVFIDGIPTGFPGGFPVGPGTGIVLVDPGMAAGEVLVSSGGVLFWGTGGEGNFSVWEGTPAICGLPIPTNDPMPNYTGELVDYQGVVLLRNPADTGGTIQYLLDDRDYQMQSGYTQKITRDAIVIRFDRGNGLGEARYQLRSGTYKFVVTENGWDLRHVKYQATLDNTANAQDFMLLHAGQEVTIAAGATQVLESMYPIDVVFDNGSGAESVQKQLSRNKTYTIGIDDQTGLWDLFVGDALASGVGRADDYEIVATLEDESERATSSDGVELPVPELSAPEPSSDRTADDSESSVVAQAD